MPSQAISQMNIRINKSTKEAGDKVLAVEGTTPTELIRALWEKISHGVADLRQVEQAIGFSAREPASSTVDKGKIEAMRRGRRLFAEGLATWNLSVDNVTPRDGVSDIDQYAMALVDRMRERDLW